MFAKDVFTGSHDYIPMSVPTSHDIEVHTYMGVAWSEVALTRDDGLTDFQDIVYR
jgi:hypothetical protein